MENRMIPIPEGLQMGAQTAQWVFDQITTFPESHDQRNWIRDTSCGTEACVAGWAALAHGQEFVKQFSHDGEGCDCDSCTLSNYTVDWAAAGMWALQLDPVDADEMFRGRNDREALLRALKDVANGQKPDLEDLRNTRNPW